LGLEDTEGNQIWRIVIMNEAVDDFVKAARNEPFAVRRFTYNYEQYKKDLENR